MKKRINLFWQKNGDTPNSPYVQLRNVTVLLLILVFASGIGLYFYSRHLDNKIRTLRFNKTVLTHQIQDLNKNVPKIKTLIANKNTLENYLKDDAKFLPYFNFLNTHLLSMKGKPVLLSFSIDKAHSSTFKLVFSNYDDLHEFLKSVESENFAQHFEDIDIGAFSINKTDLEYEIEVKAVFKPIYEQT